MAENKTYEISVVCRNCGSVIGFPTGHGEIIPKKFPVPKGVTVKQFLIDMTCENCGCEGYMGLLNQPG